MKKYMSILLFAVIITATTSAFARSIDPIVSTDWLEANASDVTILDIRSAEAYGAGHIPGAINEPWIVPFSAWITMPPDGLLLEMPSDQDLAAALGDLGITSSSRVVVVTAPNAGEPVHYGVAGATRVAMTLTYAGVTDVAVLDGGYPLWVKDGKAVTTDVPTVLPITFDGVFNHDLIASIDDVSCSLRRTTLVDSRDAGVYFGATIEPFAPVAGHIPGATSLPGPFAFDAVDDIVTFKDINKLCDMAKGVIGKNWPFWVPVEYKDVIVYCGVGGYASIWTYILVDVLGYRNVRMYDGSAQEWVAAGKDMNAYIWEW